MGAYLLRLFIVFSILFPATVNSKEEDPSSCDCKTINISTEEQLNGCTADVKWDKCPKFRDAAQGGSSVLDRHRLKQLEDSMNPGHSGAFRTINR